MAGLTGAVVVLPQAVAYATLAGMPIQYGLYAAMVPCFIAALFGSSRLMVTGPANAISLTTAYLISPLAEPYTDDYVDLVLVLCFLVGLLQLLLGVARLGRWIDKVPHSVVVGFTAGVSNWPMFPSSCAWFRWQCDAGREADDDRVRHLVDPAAQPGDAQQQLEEPHEKAEHQHQVDVVVGVGFGKRRNQVGSRQGDRIGGTGHHQPARAEQGGNETRDHRRIQSVLDRHAGERRVGDRLRQDHDGAGEAAIRSARKTSGLRHWSCQRRNGRNRFKARSAIKLAWSASRTAPDRRCRR